MICTTINGRWDLLLPEHRAARPEWPTWEQERLASMHDLLEPGMLVYDIGAEEGDLPALWASWGCFLGLIEPNPRVWPNIRCIFEANDLEEFVRGCYVGFCDEKPRDRPEWTAKHHGDGFWPGCTDGPLIGDHGFLVLDERPDCPATTIDQLADRWEPPDAITIDVEGAELRALRGARHTLEQHRPLVWVSIHTDVEWMTRRYQGEDAPAVHDYMASLDYRGTHLATDHEEHWLFEP